VTKAAVEEPTITKRKKVQQVRSSKSILIVFFDVKGIVHHEFVPPNCMVKSDFYSHFEMLERMCDRKETRTMAQQLAPSSRLARPHVCD
jgi:hypothetical protein